uniref:SET domain-containing protein n=1 Tax=Anopheles melas TaxID=34690 RepID=A0A182U4E7_9DIPT
MSERLQDNACDVVKLFDQLWEKSLKQRIIEPTQNQSNKDNIPEIIKREIDEFLRTFPFHDRLKLQPDTKDNANAVAARNRGNELFAAEGEYLKSLQHYNESIACSEPGSETRALAYGNRSAVCLRFDMYEECLENIRLARASNYPARLADKLNKREQHVKRCIEEMDAELSDGKPIEVGKHRPRYLGYPVLKLSYEAHANVPQLVKCVELRQDSEFGRHLVTAQKLKVSHMKSCEIDQEDEYEFNYFGYDSDDEEKYEERTHAIAVYPMFSMVNHSCIPNVAPIHLLDGRCAFVACRPIAAGEQLFDVYGFGTMEFDSSLRLLCLEQCYYFKCRCAVCESFSYVSVRNMNQEEEKFLRALSDSMQVEKHLPKLIEYMNEVERRYPKHQYTAAEVMLVRSLRIIHSYSLEDDVENEFGNFGVRGLGQPL